MSNCSGTVEQQQLDLTEFLVIICCLRLESNQGVGLLRTLMTRLWGMFIEDV